MTTTQSEGAERLGISRRRFASIVGSRPGGPDYLAQNHDELLRLVNRIDALLDDTQGRAIQLVAPAAGVGTSTVARGLAEVAVERHGGPVLLLDANTIRPTAHADLPTTDTSVVACLERGEDPARAIVPIAGHRYEFARMVDRALPWGHAVPVSVLERAMTVLRERYRWLVVDTAPPQETAETIPLARNVDATVMVIEAEKTRVPVAQRMLQDLRLGGGKPAGVIVNKRRFYIPQWLYHRI